jgi:hypothetical protein
LHALHTSSHPFYCATPPESPVLSRRCVLPLPSYPLDFFSCATFLPTAPPFFFHHTSLPFMHPPPLQTIISSRRIPTIINPSIAMHRRNRYHLSGAPPPPPPPARILLLIPFGWWWGGGGVVVVGGNLPVARW